MSDETRDHAGPCARTLPGAAHHRSDHRAAARPGPDPRLDPGGAAGAGHAGGRPDQPVPHQLAQRSCHRWFRPGQRPRAALRSHGVPARIIGLVGEALPDRRPQGRRGLRLPGPAPGGGRVRPDAPQGGLALDRKLLPRRRVRLGAAGLPGRGDPARRDEPGALRLAARRSAREIIAHAGQRVERQGDLRRLLGDPRRPNPTP